MKYMHTMVRVKDLDKSLNFYCNQLGMKEVKRIENNKGRFSLVFLCASKDLNKENIMNAPLIELTYNWPSDNDSILEYVDGTNFGHIAFKVDNIYKTCSDLQQSGITINRPPRDGNMAFIKSPDNISIELLQSGDPLALEEPWKSMKNNGTW